MLGKGREDEEENLLTYADKEVLIHIYDFLFGGFVFVFRGILSLDSIFFSVKKIFLFSS